MLGGQSMEKVIGLLFDIEKKANQILDRANDEKNELLEESEKTIAKMEAEIADENNSKINLIMAQAEKELESEKQQLIAASNKQLSDIETNFKQNYDALVDKVFKSIIQI
jgi:vacuolar-type H+-ATPase subunit E/Vma4